MLNNTYRSHEFVNILSRIEADKGIVFNYADNEKLKKSGFAVEGKTVNGFVDTNTGAVTLNVQLAKSWQSVVGHEITHVLEGTDAYESLQKALYAYAESKGELANRRGEVTELYKGMNADIDLELTAELIGDYLFTDKEFVTHLTTDRNLFQKIYDEIKYLYKVATGKEHKEIAKVKKEFDKAWKELNVKSAESEQKNNTADKSGVRYSMGGKNAESANKSLLFEAERMAENGVDNETIRKETGWFKGYDGMWRFEIDDSEMKVALNGKYSRDPQIRRYTELTDKVYFQNDYTQSEFDELQELDKKLENKSVEPKKLGDLIEHKKLFEAYPQLQEISVVYESGLGNTRGVYDSVFNEIVLNNNLRFNPEQFKKTLVHEIQHAIQDIEGFAYGSSPEYWESAKHRYTAKEKEQTEQLKWDIYNMERAVKKEFGSEAWRNIVKYKTLQDIYVEEDIDTESLEKQLEDIENEAEEQGYNEWLDKYYYAKTDLDSIDRRVERRKHRSNDELYLYTAGEIEARDVSNRVDLTEEQRKNTQPDINRMGVVFSDYGTESNSIGYTTNGEPVLVVNDDILRDARTDKEIVNVVKQYIGRFKTIPIRGQKIFFTSKSKKEYVNSKYTNQLKNKDKQKYLDKMRMAGHPYDIIYATTDYVNEAPSHKRKDNLIDFSRGKLLADISGRQYTADVVIGFTKSGICVLYDIVSIQPTQFEYKKEATSVEGMDSYESTRSDITSSKDSIPNSIENVNKNSLSNEADDIAPVGNFSTPLNELYYDDFAPIRSDIVPAKVATDTNVGGKSNVSDNDDIAPTVAENVITDAPIRDDVDVTVYKAIKNTTLDGGSSGPKVDSSDVSSVVSDIILQETRSDVKYDEFFRFLKQIHHSA